jgi:hypothetical protein
VKAPSLQWTRTLPPFGAQCGQVVEDVSEGGVQGAVVVVVGDVGHAVHVVAERLTESAQVDDGEVGLAGRRRGSRPECPS